jgi:hypothetical protein
MPTIKDKVEKAERKYEPQAFAKAPAKRLENGTIVLELPANLGNELEIDGGEVFITMTSGVLQVSAKEPQVTIPLLNLAEDFGTPRV